MRDHLAVLAVAGLAACGGAGTVYPPVEQTRAEFEAVCQSLQRDNAFFGERIVEEQRQRLENPSYSTLERAQLLGGLAWELNRLGRQPEAIAEIERARELLRGLPGAAAREVDHRLVLLAGHAHLRWGEDVNCVGRHNAHSCILPVDPAAVHQLPEPARAAARLYREFLESEPANLHVRWLLNVATMVVGDDLTTLPDELRLPAGALTSATDFPQWREIAGELGVAAFDLAGGAVMDDFDGDGLLDLVSSTMDPCGPLKAFRNDGRGGFEDVAAAWGLDGQLGGLNLMHADLDGDGMLDLVVLRGGWMGEDGKIRKSYLKNELRGTAGSFVDATFAAGLAYPAYPTQAAGFADFDGDGDLDLYVGNEAPVSYGSNLAAGLGADEGVAYPSQLFRNNGDGTFTDVAEAAGVTNDWMAKGVAWGDVDEDGDPDLYVSNIGPNRLYRNNGDGTFTDAAPEAGVVEPSGRSFATWFFDFDNDADLDLFVAAYNVGAYRNVGAAFFGQVDATGAPVVYRNDGGRFTDVSRELGLDRLLLPMGANHGDLDNDGFLDFYLGTGLPQLDGLMPNVMYRNDGGRRFQDVTFAGGFGQLQKGHGVAFGDLDNDGDQDLFEQLGGAFPGDAYPNALWENPGGDHHWLTLRLTGDGRNPYAVGARVEVRLHEGDTRRSVHALVGSGGSFGGSSLQQEIGLGKAEAIDEVLIRWPGRTEPQRFQGVAMDGAYRAVVGAAALEPVSLPRLTFGAATAAPEHEHRP